jgi:hypothetical protein
MIDGLEMPKGLKMYKIASLTAALALVATSSFAGGPTIVQPEAVVAPVAMDSSTPTGSLGGYLPWLIGAAAVAAVVIAADDSSSGT